MADLSCTYTLATGAGTITFNSGTLGDGTDKYWLNGINGLDGPAIRAPVDLVPFGDGGYVHTFWKGPRRVTIDGSLLLENLTNACQERRNDLGFALQAALASIIQASGTLSWTPAGQSAMSLAVFNEVPLDIQYTDNFLLSSFSFGLISESPDPA